MESPIEVVCRFCAAWSDDIGAAELAAFFTDDAVYHNIPLAPITGRESIANNIALFIRPGAPGIEGIQFRIINIAANGPVVMTERVDVFKLPDRSFELPVMGTFEVSDGKISAWRDYFDMNQFSAGWDRAGRRSGGAGATSAGRVSCGRGEPVAPVYSSESSHSLSAATAVLGRLYGGRAGCVGSAR